MTSSKDSIDIIKDLIESNIPKDRYRTIWYGDPLNISNRDLPSLTIFSTSDSPQFGRTQCDNEEETIEIRQLIDKRAIIKDNHKEVFGLRLLRDWVKGKDDTTGRYKTDSIYGVIRELASFPDQNGNPRILTQTNVGTEYFVLDNPELTTYESVTTLTFITDVKINNRQ